MLYIVVDHNLNKENIKMLKSLMNLKKWKLKENNKGLFMHKEENNYYKLKLIFNLNC